MISRVEKKPCVRITTYPCTVRLARSCANRVDAAFVFSLGPKERVRAIKWFDFYHALLASASSLTQDFVNKQATSATRLTTFTSIRCRPATSLHKKRP